MVLLRHIQRWATLVSAHARAMSAATEGRIAAKTAEKLLELVDQLTQIDSQRAPKPRSTAASLIKEAQTITTDIASAARYAATTHKPLADQLREVHAGKKKRGIEFVAYNLELHVALLRAHPRTIGALLPASTIAEGGGC